MGGTFETFDARLKIGDGGTSPRWVLDNEIVFLAGAKVMTVAVKISPTFSAGTPQVLLDSNASDFDLTRDGRIVIVEAPDPSSAPGRR